MDYAQLGVRRRHSGFVAAMLTTPEFVESASALATRIAPYGASNSLAQLAVRLASPGVPDVYQGSELRDLSLVDPDTIAAPLTMRFAVRFCGISMHAVLLHRTSRSSSCDRSPMAGSEASRSSHGLKIPTRRPRLVSESSYRAIDGGHHTVPFERAASLTKRLVLRRSAAAAFGDAREDTMAHRRGLGDARIDVGRGSFVDVLTNAIGTTPPSFLSPPSFARSPLPGWFRARTGAFAVHKILPVSRAYPMPSPGILPAKSYFRGSW